MNKRIQKNNEKYYSHNYKFDRFDPPLKVLSAIVSRWGPGDSFAYQSKKVMSLNLVTMGTARYVQNGVEGMVQANEVFLAHKGASQTFSTGSEGFLHKRTLMIEGSLLDPFLRTTGLINYDCAKPVDPGLMVDLFRRAYAVMRTKPPRFTVVLSSLIHEILAELARSIAPEYPPAVQASIEYMKRNLHRPLDLAKIALASRLSVRHFSRLFREHLGTSPKAFFINRKMDLAETMLLNTSLPVKQIAAVLGYDDQFHFSLQFKRHAGESPLLFRKHSTG